MSNTHQTGWIRCVELHKSSVRAANINVKWSKLNWVHYRALSNRWKLFGAKKKKRKKRAREASGRKKSVVEIWMKSWWIRRRALKTWTLLTTAERACVCSWLILQVHALGKSVEIPIQISYPLSIKVRQTGRQPQLGGVKWRKKTDSRRKEKKKSVIRDESAIKSVSR